MFKVLVWFKNVLTMYRKPSKFTDYKIHRDFYGEEYIVLASGEHYTIPFAVKEHGNCYITVNSKNVRVLRFYRDVE